MKLTLKTLQQVTFQIEVEGSEKISQVKEKIEAEKGFPAGSQKLIHSGKILSDDVTVEDCKITEKDFVVVMVSKPRASSTAQPSTQPAATTSTVESKPAPSTTTATPAPPASTPASTTSAAAAAPPASSFDASTLATGPAYENAVANLIDMGFPREDVVRAMRAAFNNPDRAAEYLMTGIPESVARDVLPAASSGAAPAQAATTPTTAASAPAPSNQPLNLFEAAAAQARSGTGAGAQPAATGAAGGLDLSSLRNSQQFQQLRRLVAAQPELLQPLLQQLAQSNPQFMQLISQNQDQFLQMLTGDGGEEGGEEGNRQYITITPEEDAAIQRLTALGFERALAIEAFLACDKNEELAANYLFDQAQGDEWQ